MCNHYFIVIVRLTNHASSTRWAHKSMTTSFLLLSSAISTHFSTLLEDLQFALNCVLKAIIRHLKITSYSMQFHSRVYSLWFDCISDVTIHKIVYYWKLSGEKMHRSCNVYDEGFWFPLKIHIKVELLALKCNLRHMWILLFVCLDVVE